MVLVQHPDSSSPHILSRSAPVVEAAEQAAAVELVEAEQAGDAVAPEAELGEQVERVVAVAVRAAEPVEELGAAVARAVELAVAEVRERGHL